jgi:hypothetical protein
MMNPAIYKDPERWDPERFLPDRAEDKKVPHAYMGWGLGRHPCLGMRVTGPSQFLLIATNLKIRTIYEPQLLTYIQCSQFAKLEMGILTAVFFTMFDFSVVDVRGIPMTEIPNPDRNRHGSHESPTPIRLKCKPRN